MLFNGILNKTALRPAIIWGIALIMPHPYLHQPLV